MLVMLDEIKKDIHKGDCKERAELSQRYFKTGPGEYAEGDIFLGLTTAQAKEIAKKYKDLGISDIQLLLNTNVHEYRGISLGILIHKYKKARDSEREKKKIVDFYLKNARNVNNWDLVDGSAPKILGNFLLNKKEKERKILYKLAKSSNLWERRIAIISCYEFIRNNDFSDALKISEILIGDKHDLIHKAVGWMLREIGKRDREEEERFLKKYAGIMPRTMLRYSIEKFDDKKRKFYLKF